MKKRQNTLSLFSEPPTVGSALFQDVAKVRPELNYMEKTSASEVARKVVPGCRIIGLTRGQFSLIDLIYSILQRVGPSDVVVTTWSAGIKDANTVRWMCDTNLIRSFMLITDHSYKTRQAKYALALEDLFGKENIRTSEVHAKFVLIKSDSMHITIRASMNLNANRTCESFEIDDNEDIYNFYHEWVKSTFGEMPKGFVADSAVVERALDRTFQNLKNEFAWQRYFTQE